MTAQKDLKKIIRARQQKTGESYTTARAHVIRVAATAPEDQPAHPPSSERVEAVVLKLNDGSARMRVLGEPGQITFRSRDASDLIPGQVATLTVDRRWIWRGDAYVSGRVLDARLDVSKLGLAPLALTGGDLESVEEDSEPFVAPDPYARLWKKLASKPRPSFEFDGIAWGEFPGTDPDQNLTCDAAERAEAGDVDGAYELAMAALTIDLRCLDAHAQLGTLEFQSWPERAILHYEIGVRIGEMSLPPDFDGLLVWGRLYNRPFLRCLHGYGLCLWRLGKAGEARRVFERILSFNPNDNQGVRFCLDDVEKGLTWEQGEAKDEQEEPSSEARTIWTLQFDAAMEIRDRFGLQNALSYIVGEKFFDFVELAGTRPDFAEELPGFAARIKLNFKPAELEAYLKTIRASGSRRRHDGPEAVSRSRKLLEQVSLLLLDRGSAN